MKNTVHQSAVKRRVVRSTLADNPLTQDLISEIKAELSLQLRREMEELLPVMVERATHALNAQYAQIVVELEQKIDDLETEICYIHQESRNRDD